MAIPAGKSEKKDMPESTSEERESSGSTSCESGSSSGNSCSAQLGWPIKKTANCSNVEARDNDKMLKKEGSKVSEMEMMKERFGKLLLGEDMSGSGKGVCPAFQCYSNPRDADSNSVNQLQNP